MIPGLGLRARERHSKRMGSSVSYREEEGVIAVLERGTVSASDFESAIDAIARLNRETGCARVFVDARDQRSLTDGVDAYDRAVHAAGRLGSTGIRVSILVADRLVNGHRFFETVSRNRGLLTQVFDDEAAAWEWLHDDK